MKKKYGIFYTKQYGIFLYNKKTKELFGFVKGRGRNLVPDRPLWSHTEIGLFNDFETVNQTKNELLSNLHKNLIKESRKTMQYLISPDEEIFIAKIHTDYVHSFEKKHNKKLRVIMSERTKQNNIPFFVE